MWTLLEAIETALGTVTELQSISIGAEIGISAKDCPAARIVTEYREFDGSNQAFDRGAIQIILLLDLKNDLPEVYEQSIAIEEKIRLALKNIVFFNRTEYDGDAVSVFKASILRFTFKGVRNDRAECD